MYSYFKTTMDNKEDIEAPENSASIEKPQKKKDDSRKLPTLHVFLLKKLVDNDDGIMMVGTFVQRVLGLTEEEAQKFCDEDEAVFPYRFNELSASEELVHVRRTESEVVLEVDEEGNPKLDEDGKKIIASYGCRTTIEAQIPLELDSFINAFPFNVTLATAAIELSSVVLNNETVRADLLLHEKDPRYAIAFQNKIEKKDDIVSILRHRLKKTREKETDKEEKILNKIDKTKAFEFLSPYPEVSYIYDDKKQYCPRFVLSFYCIKPGFQKLVTILLPMVLVSFLAILNVVNDFKISPDGIGSNTTDAVGEDAVNHLQNSTAIESNTADADGEDAVNHLQVSTALTLTIVFVLPMLLDDQGNRDGLWTKENLNVIIFFFGLVLASVPKTISISNQGIEEIIGVTLMTLATLVLPIGNTLVYRDIQRKLATKAKKCTKNNRFLLDDSHKKWKGKDGIKDFFTVGQLLGEERKKLDDSEVYFLGTAEELEENPERIWWKS